MSASPRATKKWVSTLPPRGWWRPPRRQALRKRVTSRRVAAVHSPMAQLSAPAVLHRASDSVIGVSPGAHQHELLATLRSQGVSLFDARTQAILRTWNTRAGVQLTHAATLHPASGRLIGVRDHAILFGWHRDDEIDFSCTQTVGAPVLALLHDPSLLDGIVAVLVDGSAVVFDVTLARQLGNLPRPGGKAGSSRAVWAELLPLPSGGAPIALAILIEEEVGLRLHIQPIAPAGSGADGRAPPLTAVSWPSPPPPVDVRRPPATARADGSAQPCMLAGCCLVPAAAADGGGSSSSAASGSADATLCVLWSPALLELYPVLTSSSSAAAAATTTGSTATDPRLQRHIDGVAIGAPMPSAPSKRGQQPPLPTLEMLPPPSRPPAAKKSSSSGASSRRAQHRVGGPPPCALLSMRSPSLLTLTCGVNDGSTPLPPRLSPGTPGGLPPASSASSLCRCGIRYTASSTARGPSTCASSRELPPLDAGFRRRGAPISHSHRASRRRSDLRTSLYLSVHASAVPTASRSPVGCHHLLPHRAAQTIWPRSGSLWDAAHCHGVKGREQQLSAASDKSGGLLPLSSHHHAVRSVSTASCSSARRVPRPPRRSSSRRRLSARGAATQRARRAARRPLSPAY